MPPCLRLLRIFSGRIKSHNTKRKREASGRVRGRGDDCMEASEGESPTEEPGGGLKL